jgi:hypothetical protein
VETIRGALTSPISFSSSAVWAVTLPTVPIEPAEFRSASLIEARLILTGNQVTAGFV